MLLVSEPKPTAHIRASGKPDIQGEVTRMGQVPEQEKRRNIFWFWKSVTWVTERLLMSSVISTSYQASKVPSTRLVPQVFLISLPSYSLRKMKIASTFMSWNYSHWLTATTGWLQIPEFGKSQQEHPVRISWLYGVYNEEYCIFYYYLQIVCLISHPLKKKKVKYGCFTARNKELKVVHFQE